jgi:hypothetical protein
MADTLSGLVEMQLSAISLCWLARRGLGFGWWS